MNCIIQFLPMFVDGPELEEFFKTTEELLAIDWVAKWSHNKGFVKFSLHRDILIAEYTDSPFPEKMIIGMVTNPDTINLPKYQP